MRLQFPGKMVQGCITLGVLPDCKILIQLVECHISYVLVCLANDLSISAACPINMIFDEQRATSVASTQARVHYKR